ncbi:hypothetical protein QQX09_05045 [Demequina sp. SYSU T00192]|uniref:DUF4367 domain-containing protein n=1 Tax=Demequina litoralis TaxID=3051660 RepID=A0ABT8G7X2_9MICO|nr:hypothetical protein [Demequina sp. SYSU T00192]MDN4475225.1 hypothetical protein [Demequina sp. SYSU T00192]
MTRQQPGRGTPAHARETGTALGVAPSKPVRPRASAGTPAPVPVDLDIDHDDVAAPVPGPAADEVLPEPRSPLDAAADAEAVASARRSRSDVELLAAAAAANAAMHAAGAPTPLGGVPRVAAGAVATGPETDLSHGEPAFVPTFAPVAGGTAARAASQPGPTPVAARTTAPTPTDGTPAWLAVAQEGTAASSTAPHDPPLYRPRVMAASFPAVGIGAAEPGTAQAARDGDGETPDAAPTRPARAPRDRAWPLILVGLLVLGGILAGAAWYLLRADTVEIPGQKVLVPPVERALDPIEVEDASPFLAAMPPTVGLWSLVEVHSPNPAKDTALPDRVAEVQVLTYGDGASQITLTARQLYTDEDAAKALSRAAGKDAELADATVAGEIVGSRAVIEADGQTTVRWTHGSVYLEATGPTGEVEPFVETLGL